MEIQNQRNGTQKVQAVVHSIGFFQEYVRFFQGVSDLMSRSSIGRTPGFHPGERDSISLRDTKILG